MPEVMPVETSQKPSMTGWWVEPSPKSERESPSAPTGMSPASMAWGESLPEIHAPSMIPMATSRKRYPLASTESERMSRA